VSTPRKVLVVDDEAGLRETLAANLELEGFEVKEADSAEKALELCAAQRFDLVITDIRMPGMNGVELFRALRKQGAMMPVVLMTGFAMEELVQSALEEGAFTVLPKPFDVGHALKTVANAARLPVVLVVDDVKPVADTTAAALEACGVRAKAVHSGEEAIGALAQGGIDLCVLDLVMPGMSGPELAARLRQTAPPISLIAVSGENVPELIRQVAAVGIHTFIRKPVGVRDLLRSIAAARGVKQAVASR
jgi:CheY-like chemotaxis protein